MNLHSFRSAKPVLAAASVAVAALALSACGSGSSKTATTPPPSVPSSPSSPLSSPTTPTSPSGSPSATVDTPSAPGTAVSTPTPKSTPSKPATSKPKSGSGLAADCTTAMLSGNASAVARPINHVLLTVTNTGSAPCSVYYFPFLRFTQDQQSTTQVYQESKPQAVVTIAPGQSAYAGITTSSADGSGKNGQVLKSVEVSLATRDNSGSMDGVLKVALPANTFVDDAAHVTFWESDPDSAINW